MRSTPRRKLQRVVDTEMEWLDAHPSDPCYAGTYTSYTRYMTINRQMATIYREWIAEGDPRKSDQMNEAWRQADVELQNVADSISISDDACAA